MARESYTTPAPGPSRLEAESLGCNGTPTLCYPVMINAAETGYVGPYPINNSPYLQYRFPRGTPPGSVGAPVSIPEWPDVSKLPVLE